MSRADWEVNPINKIFGLRYPRSVSSILDVGCGLSLKSQYLTADIRVGLDAYKPFLEAIETEVPYVPMYLNALSMGACFLPNSFDVVLLLDVLEHMDAEDALSTIETAEILARKAVIIETPLGFIPQDIDIWGLGGDKWQTHRSGWTEDAFQSQGYAVFRRPYTMTDVKRHHDQGVEEEEREITLLDAIKRVDQ